MGILSDSLIGREVSNLGAKKSRRPTRETKIYLFDLGVTRILQGRKSISKKTREFGEFFEAYIYHELITWSEYYQKGPINYLKEDGHEIDFIIDDHTAIEVKATTRVNSDDLKGHQFFKDRKKFKNRWIVSLENVPRTVADEIQILPWRDFITKLYEL